MAKFNIIPALVNTHINYQLGVDHSYLSSTTTDIAIVVLVYKTVLRSNIFPLGLYITKLCEVGYSLIGDRVNLLH